MCGRYVRRSDKQRIAEAFELGRLTVDFVLPPEDYNVAPQTVQPVVRVSRETGERELALMRWGLVPFWASDTTIGRRSTNARAETVSTNKVFREAFARRRCLVPADMFYEWKNLDPADVKRKNTQPYAIAVKGEEPFAMAGLWESWRDPATGVRLETYTIVTTDPNELMEEMHDRMPVIVPRREYGRWLGGERPPVDLLRPYDAAAMNAWKVGKAVGNSRNTGAELCVRWE